MNRSVRFGEEEEQVTSPPLALSVTFFIGRSLLNVSFRRPQIFSSPSPSFASGLFLTFLSLSSYTIWPSGVDSASNCDVPFPRPPPGIFSWLDRRDTSVTRQRRGRPGESHKPLGGILVQHHRRGGSLYSAPSPPRRRPPTVISHLRNLARSECGKLRMPAMQFLLIGTIG